MDLDTYQTEARKTALYPKASIPGYNGVPIYTVLKLNGETAELAEAVRTYFVEENMGGTTHTDRENVLKEMGDVLWYIANMAHDLGYSLDEIWRKIDRRWFVDRLWNRVAREYSGRGRVNTAIAKVNFLLDASGSVAERVGKTLRDVDSEARTKIERRMHGIVDDLSHMLHLLDTLAGDFDTRLSEVAEINLEKLCSRQDRGTLQGSGNDR